MFCKKCGKQLPEEARFCINCGSEVGDTDSKLQRETVYDGKVHKCPRCGEVLKAFEIVCSSCNYELRDSEKSQALHELSERLSVAKTELEKMEVIKTFAIPNTKEDILEFVILASTNFDAVAYYRNLDKDDISDAWFAKLDQCVMKAKLFGDEKFYKEIEGISIWAKNKYCTIAKKENRKSFFKLMKPVLLGVGGVVAVSVIIFAIWLSVGGGNPNLIKIGFSDQDAVGANIMEVENFFSNKAFSNIQMYEKEWDEKFDIGEVISVQINDDKEFSSWKRFDKNSKIIITYNGAPKSVSIGLSPDEVIGRNYSDVLDILKQKGFVYIETRSSEWTPTEEIFEIKSILIDGKLEFDESSEFLQNTKIIITYNPAPKSVRIGLSTDEIEGKNCDDIKNLLIDKGFVYIETRADGWSLFHAAGSVKRISVDGKEEFDEYASFNQDAKIIIFYYE